MADPGDRSALICRVGQRICAIPLAHVTETSRLLPLDPLPGAPPFVAGLAVVRGAAVAVVDLAALLGERRSPAARLVVARSGARRVALAVDAVVGMRDLGPATELPPLLRDAALNGVSAIGALDGEVFIVLDSLRLLPDEFVAALDRREAAA